MYSHPKEKIYRTVGMVIGSLVWLGITAATMGIALLALIPIAFTLWLSEKFFESYVYGNAVLVNENQYPELYKVYTETAQRLGLAKVPAFFLFDAWGAKNALAAKFLSKKFVILYTDLVDHLREGDSRDELRFIIAHELAHHSAGHLNFWRNTIMMPSKFIPILGFAYSKACEHTADTIAMAVTGNPTAAATALVLLAGGTKKLGSSVNIKAFVAQENAIPKFFAAYQELYSTHPRLTKRVQHLIDTYPLVRGISPSQTSKVPERTAA